MCRLPIVGEPDVARAVSRGGAGPSYDKPRARRIRQVIRTPRTFPYASVPEHRAGGRVLMYPQRRLPGGGSSINGMIYIRGNRKDYDDWAAQGCAGWIADSKIESTSRLISCAPVTIFVSAITRRTRAPPFPRF
ncbi:hypothetical protein B5K11_26730 [Rhizobium leguminosarum bv. trifolii]|uniref:GMC family oxidoreductase N-terminal domain-containing protein n=1 Tax=Rhizobium leguminosarum TaxID=384 RepID=UPI000E2FEA31|nr:GMC family oxidoreductase N-terminal domain-containing protein [Rhizobium leguminosarum]RFB87538.1 hypothetical protein B5K11_26730 [Rhizobium leguminosarum bv. trifolii]